MTTEPVSPADAIRRYIQGARNGDNVAWKAERALDVLLAVGERDKAEIERLRSAIRSCTKRETAFLEQEAELRHQRERDGRQIARLTGAIERYIAADAEHQRRIDTSMLAAVLAGEEDANG